MKWRFGAVNSKGVGRRLVPMSDPKKQDHCSRRGQVVAARSSHPGGLEYPAPDVPHPLAGVERRARGVAPAGRRTGRRRPRVHGAYRQRPHRLGVAPGPQGRPDADPFPRFHGRPERGRTGRGSARHRPVPGAGHLLPLGGGAGPLPAPRASSTAPFRRRASPPTRRSGRSRWRPTWPRRGRPWRAASGPTSPPGATSASTPWTRSAVVGVRGDSELVRCALRGAPAHDGGPRLHRPALRRPGDPDHLGLHRLRRLGVGRGPLRRRPCGVQEAGLRDALRRGQRPLRPVRAVLPPGLQFRAEAAEVGGVAGGADAAGSGRDQPRRVAPV